VSQHVLDRRVARYQRSRINAGNPAIAGRGSFLVLEADAVPAKALRFVKLNTKR
jgi:hypothetical protein